MSDTRNRRRAPRYPLPIRLEGSSVQGPTWQGRVLNLGPRGLAIETRQGLRIRGLYDLLFRAPRRSYRLRGCVRWCRLIDTLKIGDSDVYPVFQVGLAVVESPQDWRAAFSPSGRRARGATSGPSD